MSRPRVGFLTDYGAGSEHVGALHAVVARGCPEADRIDLAHDVPPGDVRWGAILLARLAPLVVGGIVVAVVDPGVGTMRRALAVGLEAGGAIIGPDNGLLGLAVAEGAARAAVELTSAPGAAVTFHGRDLFAPAAARLAAGEALSRLGPPADSASVRSPDLPGPDVSPGRVSALAVGADRFGNVQLWARGSTLADAGLARGAVVSVSAGGQVIAARVGAIFADVAPGELLVHVDSHGAVALAVNGGDAWSTLGIRPREIVTVERDD